MKAHQKIIREKKALEDTNDIFGDWWKDIDVDIKKAEIKEVKYSTANQIIEEYEWLKLKG